MTDKPVLLFEVSWEVNNKVGGIHTVISSKASQAVSTFGDDYITIGPLLHDTPEFLDEEDGRFKEAAAELAKKNIPIRIGRWNIDGTPRAILVDFRNAFIAHDKLLFQLWEDFGVDSMSGSWDYIEPVLFSTACGIVIDHLSETFKETHEITAHFHEWMTGAGLLHLKKNRADVSTVFTTHATILGRAISSSGEDIYASLDEIDPIPQAKRHNISAKYSMESACAREADCFTTVSGLTAREAAALLGVEPHIVTLNGFNVDSIPDYSQKRDAFEQAREKLLRFSADFLNREFKPEKTRFLVTSGRYEFHNKGLDILIDSLDRLNRNLTTEQSDKHLICLFLVMGGAVGMPKEDRIRRRRPQTEVERYADISTHHLGDTQHDPIFAACRTHKLTNNPDDRCSIIFVPVLLDGNDGVLNMPYYEVLSGCDFGVFPSFYEPWGYTPHESLAHAVPAVTTDRSGFGIWVRENVKEDHPGVSVIPRMGIVDGQAVDRLTSLLQEWTVWDTSLREIHKKGARAVAEKADWKHFYPLYLDAYRKAAASRDRRLEGMMEEAKEPGLIFPSVNSASPRFRPFSVISDLPAPLKRLRELANNLWWTWTPEARSLFSKLDPEAWETSGHNPVSLLDTLQREKLESAAADKDYMQLYAAVLKMFDEYMRNDKAGLGAPHISADHPVAYFSMEFGLHESIPTYSGGLGVLSGDHLKSASDLNCPLVGVSLLYKFGYFNQRINRNGEQVPEYRRNNFARMPVEIVKGGGPEKLMVTLDFPGRSVKAQVWKAQAGRTSLYFLDTDVEDNSIRDREITDKLYDAETRERIEQEILLGIGGARLLHLLGIDPSVFHLNEGHSAFILIERIALLMKERGLDFDTAREVIRASTVFTTHTPVPAGIEKFDQVLVENYFRVYLQQAGLQWEQFWNLGQIYAGDSSPFDMTVCALKLSNRRNAVSRLHGRVSREMWHTLWPGFIPEELPILHVTNGVHAGSWIADGIKELLVKKEDGDRSPLETRPDIPERVSAIADADLWETHLTLKKRLFDTVRSVVKENWIREEEDFTLWERFQDRLDPKALTIGFARRFATYKRPTLLLSNPDRLKKLITNSSRPVQFILAGKAHPADRAGAELIRRIVEISKQDEFLGKIIFLENYDIRLARILVSGVDVWLNTPVRPLEASGTSGMKAAMNGVPNCSILDGWWDEAYDGTNGWAIGGGTENGNGDLQDRMDAESMYDLLEEKVIPLFYLRDKRNIPPDWIGIMKRSMATVLPKYNTHRMVHDYMTCLYEPTVERALALAEDDFGTARDLAVWKKRIANRFSTLHIQNVNVKGLQGDILRVGDKVVITAVVSRGSLEDEEIHAETVVEDLTGDSHEPYCFCEKMELIQSKNGTLTFRAEFSPKRTGQFRYGIRVLPHHPRWSSKYEPGLVLWS
ncbi:MAG: alpha-glucan family phosphorylase [Acidobacteria bacterium]|nr:alpha-glucan family phosphorylase [Acidobacteriota bacterium]